MHHLSDAALAQRAQDGHVEAVGELYDRHQARIYRYVRSRIYDSHLAQDLTGEIFLRMVTNIHRYRDMGVPFSAWLFKIARNHLINHRQKAQLENTVPLIYGNFQNSPEHNPAIVVEQRLELEQLLLALEQIDETQKEVLVLRFLVGLKLKEVADSLDKTVAAVKAIQHRGLRALRGIMSV